VFTHFFQLSDAVFNTKMASRTTTSSAHSHTFCFMRAVCMYVCINSCILVLFHSFIHSFLVSANRSASESYDANNNHIYCVCVFTHFFDAVFNTKTQNAYYQARIRYFFLYARGSMYVCMYVCMYYYYSRSFLFIHYSLFL